MRSIIIATAALALLFTSITDSQAKSKRHKYKKQPDTRALLQKLISDNRDMRNELIAIRKILRPVEIAEAPDLPPPQVPEALNRLLPAPLIPDTSKTIKAYGEMIAKSAKLKDLTPKLAVKVAEILASCPGSRLTSGHRPGARVRGSGRPSLHSHYPSKAADLAGNPSCIKSKLVGWAGGLSTDYAAVRHYHVSYAPGSREFGARFAHYRPRHRLKTHYASAQ